METHDHAIIELFFARDEMAIRRTAEDYGGLCMRVALNILGNRQDAEECVNDTYLKAWRSIPPHRPRSLGAYLTRITRNLALDRLRAASRDKRDRSMTLLYSELEECIPAPAEGDAEALLAHIGDFLRGRSELDRLLFVGRYFHAYSVNRLARGHGLTANAVSLRLLKTREALRAYLTERGYSV